MKVFEDWFRSLPEYPNIDHYTEGRYREAFALGCGAVWDEAYRSGYAPGYSSGYTDGHEDCSEFYRED
jgi:hypothetical protein